MRVDPHTGHAGRGGWSGFWGRSERSVIEALSLERVAGCYALGAETVRTLRTTFSARAVHRCGRARRTGGLPIAGVNTFIVGMEPSEASYQPGRAFVLGGAEHRVYLPITLWDRDETGCRPSQHPAPDL